MQKVTDAERALLDRYAKITLTVYLDGQRINTGVGDFELACACGSDDAFSFGNACASSIKASLDAALPNIKGRKIRIAWSVDGTEHPMFDGSVEDGLISAGKTQVEAWDAMYYGGSNAFMPSWGAGQSISAAAAFTEIAAGIGVYADPEALELLDGVTIYGGSGRWVEEISYSAAAGYVAGLIGANAMISRSGQLTIRKISSVDFESEPYAGGAQARGRNFTVTGITMLREEILTVQNEDGSAGEEESVTEFGAGDGTLAVSNPMADQTAADRAFAELEGLTFRPGSYSFPGGIILEPGDMIRIHSMDGSYDVLCAMISMTMDGGVKTTVGCGGAIQKGGAQGAINQALAMLAADFARIRKLVADNAEIVSAKISNLKADDITAGRIHSTDFAVVELPLIYPVSGSGSNLVTRSGNTIVLPDVDERALSGLTIYGRTTQSGVPSPAAPADLVSPGDDGDVAVTVSGKNLADLQNTVKFVNNIASSITVTETSNSLTISGATSKTWAARRYIWYFPAGIYTLSAKMESDKGVCNLPVYASTNLDSGYKYQAGLTASGSISFTLAESCYLEIRPHLTTDTSTGGETWTTRYYDIQIERGGTATGFVEANNHILTVSTPNGLPGIPVPSDGNYTDASGQQWICDEIDFARGKHVHRIGKIDSYNGETVSGAFLSSSGDLTSGAVVLYTLAAATETAIPSDELAAYAALTTVGPGTTLCNDAGAYMTVSYIVGKEDLIYPSGDLYPNNGEQIIRGFEIDFASGIIRGVFWSEESEKLARRIETLEQNQREIDERLQRLEAGQT